MLQVKYISSVKSRKQRKQFNINCEFDSPGELMKTWLFWANLIFHLVNIKHIIIQRYSNIES